MAEILPARRGEATILQPDVPGQAYRLGLYILARSVKANSITFGFILRQPTVSPAYRSQQAGQRGSLRAVLIIISSSIQPPAGCQCFRVVWYADERRRLSLIVAYRGQLSTSTQQVL